ncbi:hypothetical protein KFK09_005144 [Dendrobium nobile]|uniref:Reverse transcriptase domain-containing protein n=1 Tax=Dendrobium nobile TaxID=94219 RepID=A0A8T3C028_DENNO|nr:hypothetical protein KFK09_005144 [Dendrobium nobile]
MSLPAIAAWNVRDFNNPTKAKMCKDLIATFNLKLLCILEAKIHQPVNHDPWFYYSRVLFNNEMCCDNFSCADPGRIWIKWDSSQLIFSPSFTSSQVIHGIVEAGSLPPLYLSVVYAANELVDRKALWNDLLSISNAGIQDLASVGLFYTWYNQRGEAPIHIKLDRMLVNPAFLDLFPEAYYKVADHMGSDHSPLVLFAAHVKRKASKFMFKAFWTEFDEFWKEVLNAFHDNVGASPIIFFYDCLKHLKEAIRGKRRSSSNYISSGILELKILQHQILADIQNDPLNQALNFSLKDTNVRLASFQLAWYSWISQRAKAYWLSHGEDDLGFLYAKIRSTKNCNSIIQLASPAGLLSLHDEMASALIGHFRDIYNLDSPPFESSFNIPTGSKVPNHLLSDLICPVTNEEIKKVVFEEQLSILFHLVFCPKKTKATAITLILKGTHSNAIFDYRPISLCNVFYKIVAKILAYRMKPILPFIIHESQSGFISNGCSTDNIILAVEVLREFKANNKYFCAKLDIKKAFDSVSRTFFINRLREKGFPEIFIRWIKRCIMDVNFSICLNGSLEGFFSSSSGLRQGRPLSPLLFCIIMDALSSSLDAHEAFVGLKIHNLNINHLMYADDLLVFVLASMENVTSLNDILHTFAKASGLFINPVKSSLMLSKSVLFDNAIAATLEISRVEDFITYLGIPISTSRLKFAHFQPLLSRISTLLAGWKVKFLSFTGRSSYPLGNRLLRLLLSFGSCNVATFILPFIPFLLTRVAIFHFFGTLGDLIAGDMWRLPNYLSVEASSVILETTISGEQPVLTWEGSPTPPPLKVLATFYEHLDNVVWSKYVWHKKHALRYSCYSWMARTTSFRQPWTVVWQLGFTTSYSGTAMVGSAWQPVPFLLNL